MLRVTPVFFVRPFGQPITFYPALNGPRGADSQVISAGATGCMQYMDSAGSAGSADSQSIINYTGATGNRGPIAYTGPTGILGPVGHSGPTGEQGPMGPEGRHGLTGPTGHAYSAMGYVWAFKTNIQYIITPLIFETLTFTETPELIGWNYNNLNGAFTCLNSGKYSVSYIVEARANSGLSSATVRCAINSVGINGSAVTHTFITNPFNQSWVSFFVMTIRRFDMFTLEITGSTTDVLIAPSNQIAGENPVAASLIITRLA